MMHSEDYSEQNRQDNFQNNYSESYNDNQFSNAAFRESQNLTNKPLSDTQNDQYQQNDALPEPLISQKYNQNQRVMSAELKSSKKIENRPQTAGGIIPIRKFQNFNSSTKLNTSTFTKTNNFFQINGSQKGKAYILHDKERLYEDVLILRNKINVMNKDLNFYKTKLSSAEAQLSKYKKMYEETISEMDNDIELITAQKKGLKFESGLAVALKNQMKDLIQQNQAKEKELISLKKMIKYSKLNELEIYNKILTEDYAKIKKLYENLFIESSNRMNEFEMIFTQNQQLKNNCEKLQIENQEFQNVFESLLAEKSKNEKELQEKQLKIKKLENDMLIQKNKLMSREKDIARLRNELVRSLKTSNNYGSDINQKQNFGQSIASDLVLNQSHKITEADKIDFQYLPVSKENTKKKESYIKKKSGEVEENKPDNPQQNAKDNLSSTGKVCANKLNLDNEWHHFKDERDFIFYSLMLNKIPVQNFINSLKNSNEPQDIQTLEKFFSDSPICFPNEYDKIKLIQFLGQNKQKNSKNDMIDLKFFGENLENLLQKKYGSIYHVMTQEVSINLNLLNEVATEFDTKKDQLLKELQDKEYNIKEIRKEFKIKGIVLSKTQFCVLICEYLENFLFQNGIIECYPITINPIYLVSLFFAPEQELNEKNENDSYNMEGEFYENDNENDNSEFDKKAEELILESNAISQGKRLRPASSHGRNNGLRNEVNSKNVNSNGADKYYEVQPNNKNKKQNLKDINSAKLEIDIPTSENASNFEKDRYNGNIDNPDNNEEDNYIYNDDNSDNEIS